MTCDVTGCSGIDMPPCCIMHILYKHDAIVLRLSTWHQGRRQVKICGVDRHGKRGARAYNGGLGAEAEKVLRFGHAIRTANLPYKLQLSVLWKLSKPLLFVISLQNWGAIAAVESRCKATLFTRSKTFRVEQHQYEGWTDTAGSKETEFTISLCVVPYRATRCIRYSDLLVVNQNNVYTGPGCVQCCLLHHWSESCTQQLVPNYISFIVCEQLTAHFPVLNCTFMNFNCTVGLQLHAILRRANSTMY